VSDVVDCFSATSVNEVYIAWRNSPRMLNTLLQTFAEVMSTRHKTHLLHCLLFLRISCSFCCYYCY